MSLMNRVVAGVMFAAVPLTTLSTQPCPQATRLATNALFGSVNVHMRDLFASPWVASGVKDRRAGIAYHVSRRQIELLARAERRSLSHQALNAPRTPFDVIYSVGVSLRLPF